MNYVYQQVKFPCFKIYDEPIPEPVWNQAATTLGFIGIPFTHFLAIRNEICRILITQTNIA
jgi:hypothetical protein